MPRETWFGTEIETLDLVAVGEESRVMTLKAFKAAIKPGLKVRVVEHWIERYRNTVRTVTAVQSNGYWFTQPGEPKRCWGAFPKASQLQFDGTIAKIIVDDERHWTLQLPAN